MLKHITFTGIGVDTDFQKLREIQLQYPIVEYGVLLSKNWAANGPRYFDPSKLESLRGLGLNLSCHACGNLAYEALNNNWGPLRELTQGSLDIFSRCQLNISHKEPRENTPKLRPPQELDEVIIQQKNADNLTVFNCIENKENISVILDASGGHGVDTPIEIMKMDGVKVGYAGGMNPDNVYRKLRQLLASDCGDFWIDMESGVRTNDVFDLDKVEKVLRQYDIATMASQGRILVHESLDESTPKFIQGPDIKAVSEFCTTDYAMKKMHEVMYVPKDRIGPNSTELVKH